MGQEASKLFKRVAQKMSIKTQQRYSDTISFIGIGVGVLAHFLESVWNWFLFHLCAALGLIEWCIIAINMLCCVTYKITCTLCVQEVLITA